MSWFIFSEVMFFGAFFGALFWIARRTRCRRWAASTTPCCGPTSRPSGRARRAGATASPAGIIEPFQTMGPWPIPTINTALLLTSGVTLTIAHHALLANHRGAHDRLHVGHGAARRRPSSACRPTNTIHAYTELNLKLSSGVYGSTFFMLTGFHGFHVIVGMLMLLFITLRLMRGHFTPERHFGFEGAAWYWHFVDVVWLGLYTSSTGSERTPAAEDDGGPRVRRPCPLSSSVADAACPSAGSSRASRR